MSEIAGTPVSRHDLEAGLARAEAVAGDPLTGLFGPQSEVWRVQREALLFFGAGRAMTLQTAHPWVAEGVARQSKSMTDPLGRFHRTFVMVFSMVFGSLPQAFDKARALHRIHSAIRGPMAETVGPFAEGSLYRANDVEAMLWVHATLWETSVLMHEQMYGPWEQQARDAYYAETRRFAWLFGLPDDVVPKDWAAFEAYNKAMVDGPVLAVGRAGRHVVDTLLRGVGPSPRPWLPYWYLALTAESLPPRLREGFDIPYGPREEKAARVAWDRIRAWYPRLPHRLRYVAPYHEALGRIAGRSGPGLLTRALNLAWVGRSSLVP